MSSEAKSAVKLDSVYAFKLGMSSVYNDRGDLVPVTVLRLENWVISQIKTKEKDGYCAIQIAAVPHRKSRSVSAGAGHLKAAGLKTSARFLREVRVDSVEGFEVGAPVSLESLVKGDKVKVISTSKGKGFAGSVKRHNFGGGPAAHGSHFHRQPGSSGNRTWPCRVMQGKRFPGLLEDETVTLQRVEVVNVVPGEHLIAIKGPVPGGRNTFVQLTKE